MKPVAPDTPGLVFSNELQGVEIQDPEVIQRELSDSKPEYEAVVSRTINFNDRIAVNINPAGVDTPYYDYTWWEDINNLSNSLNVLFLMTDGSSDFIRVPRKQGSLEGLPATFRTGLSYEKVQNGFIVEFKKGVLKFYGDPLFFNKPSIALNTCPDLAGLY
ncbi:hypothetical protein [Chitinophaga sp. YIM B06452]|uniref:hypothetical protein n=1 Tax=Chitinophaga sp. YIM B06452 TaxID=3082158 RepID=UPI0031FF405B